MRNDRTIAYVDTPQIQAWRAEMHRHNAALLALQLYLPGYDLEAPLIEVNGLIIPPWKRALYRVFIELFELGGRLFGGFWQLLPKSVRRLLLVDGHPIEELDYPHLHPTLLYARRGLSLEEDAYTLSQAGFERRLIKDAWLRMVNARSRQAALASFRQEYPRLGKPAVEALFEALEDRHAAIRDCFYTCPSLGLQYLDSELLLAVMNACLNEGIVGLPIHDSLIVPQVHVQRTTQIMDVMLDALLEELRAAARGVAVTTAWPRGPLPPLRSPN